MSPDVSWPAESWQKTELAQRRISPPLSYNRVLRVQKGESENTINTQVHDHSSHENGPCRPPTTGNLTDDGPAALLWNPAARLHRGLTSHGLPPASDRPRARQAGQDRHVLGDHRLLQWTTLDFPGTLANFFLTLSGLWFSHQPSFTQG